MTEPRAAASMGTRGRVSFDALPSTAQAAVEAEIGKVRHVDTVGSGLNSTFAAVLQSGDATVFVKGMPSDHARIRGQQREAAIAPHVASIAPRLRWQLDIDGWSLLAFDYLPGRAADLSPGSADLGWLATSLAQLGELTPPELRLPRIEQRWNGLADDADLALLTGEHLLHTDLNPNNILISSHRAWLVDWAWPTLGAAWIDPACAILWLIAEGHSPAAAETWAKGLATWRDASQAGIDTFVAVNARLWTQIADQDPQPWKLALRDATTRWQSFRRQS